MSDQAPHMGGREWGLLVALSILWGASFFFFKVLVAAVPPFTIVLGRVGIAAIALNLYCFARRDPMRAPLRLWGAFLVMGLLNNVVPFTLIVFCESRVSSGLASILNATTPIVTILAAHFATEDEKLTPAKGLGVALGFLGVAVLIGPAVLSASTAGDGVGELAGLGAALSYAFAGIYGRRFKGLPPLKIATGQVSASTLVLLPLSLSVERPWLLPLPDAKIWGAFLGLGLLSTALAYLIYFRILAIAGATNLLLVTFLLPISALMLGVALLGETISPAALGGMMLIGLGLAAIDGRPWRTLRRRPRLC